MRILLLHSSSDIYGASKIFLQTVQLLKRNGHFLVVVLSNPGSLATALEKEGVHVHIINLAIIRRKYFNIAGIIDRYKKWKLAVRELDYIIHHHQIDTVYSNTAAVLVGGFIAKKKNLQHIWHLHEIIERPVFMHKFLAWCLRNWSDKIIVVSKAVEANWQDALNKPSALNEKPKPNMFQVYNGILPLAKSNAVSHGTHHSFRESLAIPNQALVIGMAARIHYWKGQPYFIDIARELLKREEENILKADITAQHNTIPLYFIIAGDPFAGYEHLQIQMEHAIKSFHLEHRIFYIGLVKDMDLFYKSIDLLILPSQLADPLPTVVLEAMQYAKPVVATSQGGALEMIIGDRDTLNTLSENNTHAQTGIFIPLDNVIVAVDKIVSILVPNKLLILGAAGKQRVDTYFSAAAFENNILSVFEHNSLPVSENDRLPVFEHDSLSVFEHN